MGEKGFKQRVGKLYAWVGQRLSACPIRDGMTFYHRSEKVFKLVKQRAQWHLQFNVPVPECPGLTVLSQEEARRRKLGKAQWIYKGDSDRDAELLVRAALSSLPQRRVIDPALGRDITTVCGGTCPCFRKMERLAALTGLPESLHALLQEAYSLLMEGQYVEFVQRMQVGIAEELAWLMHQNGHEGSAEIQENIRDLVRLHVIPKSMESEGEALFTRRGYENFHSIQDRAYPMALMSITFLKRLLKYQNVRAQT